MILWFIDRFGLPGKHHTIWQSLIRDVGLDGREFRFVSLHNALKKPLLQRHGSRKEPTWIPEEAITIGRAIDTLVIGSKARAVVLAAPESLACLGMHADHATLHNLRGSVYWRHGVPHLVMLPMSAWHSMVTQKEIGQANYGFETPETLAARSASDSEHGTSRVGGGQTRPSLVDLSGQLQAKLGWIPGGRENAPERSDDDSDGIRDGSADDEAAEELGDEDSSAAAADRDSLRSDAAGDSTGSSGLDSHRADELPDEELVDEETVDRFFYEPIMSPIGRFALTADTQKLARLLAFGKRASGPRNPIRLKYR